MRLFEFAFVNEATLPGSIIRNGIEITRNEHIYERDWRGITEDDYKLLMRRIPDLKNKFKDFTDNQMFYIWSKSMKKGIGLRRRYRDGDKNIRVEVMTPIHKYPYNNDYAPAFEVG